MNEAVAKLLMIKAWQLRGYRHLRNISPWLLCLISYLCIEFHQGLAICTCTCTQACTGGMVSHTLV